jgi:multidrug efflux system membrane fusion protein
MKFFPPAKIATVFAITLIFSACSSENIEPEKRLVLAIQAQSSDQHAQAFAGEIRARQETSLSFRVAGKVQQRFVDNGARVKVGQVLARLDDQDLLLQNQMSGASVQALKADRDLAKAELIRYQGLVEKQLVSKSLYESKQAQASAAQARYQQALAQSSVNANQTAYAVLSAPNSGVISKRLLEAGQVVAAGQTVFVFAADGARDVAITVAEKHLPALSIGQSVWVELWTAPGQRYPAKIREIAASADELTRTYAVRVALDDKQIQTQLGQSARVLLSNTQNSILAVPLSALTEINGKPAVWVINQKDGSLHKRPVHVKQYGAQNAEIDKGISANDWIVQAGVHLLRDNEKVRAIDHDNRPIVFSAQAGHAP